MKKLFIILILIFIFPALLLAQDFSGRAKKIKIELPKDKLTVGEKLIYSIEWLGVSAGEVTLTVMGIVNINGYECYHVNAKAIPNDFLKHFYDIEYDINSYIDVNNFYPHRFEKTRRVKDIYTYQTVDFDHKTGEATYKYRSPQGVVEVIDFPSLKKMKIGNEDIAVKIPSAAQDLLSAFYYFRRMNVDIGKKYNVNIAYERKNWPVEINIKRPFFRDIYHKGVFSVFEIFPDSKLNIYLFGRSKVSIYICTDSNRLPLLFTLSSTVGAIRGVIKELPK